MEVNKLKKFQNLKWQELQVFSVTEHWHLSQIEMSRIIVKWGLQGR